VREAVEAGTIARDRWESYLALLEELESAPEEWE
jgi:putative ribosome biogenesis GTPase RsgA